MEKMNEYDPSAVEAKWQNRWDKDGVHVADLQKAKNPYYSLVMFPYPSGDKLHVGHWYNFAPADSYARFMRMQGHDVFEPMGFDAFGLPAENYAIKTGVHPDTSIADNVKTMIAQLKRIGCMYDWEKMVNTSQPEYYQWTQWVFLQMYKHGLSYKKKGNVNYCPKDQTVLANEQVWEGKCERCGTEVIQKPLEQWYWKITDYSQRLLDGLDTIDWPEKTKLMQRNWIGRSEGAEIFFDVENAKEKIKVFTTRPDTLFGVTYIVLSPEHPLVEVVMTNDRKAAIHSYRERARRQTELQREQSNIKTGEFTGSFAMNPVTEEKIPIWIADYVLMNYGTGAVMAVPGHDERDYDFAGPHDLPMKCVIQPQRKIANFGSYVHPNFAVSIEEGRSLEKALEYRDNQDYELILNGQKCWTGPGTLINSDFLNGLTVEDAKKEMISWLEKEKHGKRLINYRLRDWLISRQRYWGAPIPIVYDPDGKPNPIPQEHLPWLLPTDVEFKPTGESPLKHSKEFIERTEKIFGKGWTPEYDTMDTFVCSSFYYLRYLMAANQKPATSNQKPAQDEFLQPQLEKKWLPVSMYIGGPEHACMHLIYARFVMMALKDFGIVSHSEPFRKLVHQGLITNKGAKMSKSKGNVVSPDAFVEHYGSDVFRMYLMFMGPFTAGGDWSDLGIRGIVRFSQRMWRLLTENVDAKMKSEDKEVLAALHKTIKKVTDDIGIMHFNTAISALMELLNMLEKRGKIHADTAATIVLLLGPFAPHFADELWEKLDKKGYVVDQSWPKFDPALIVASALTIAVQVNGKVRGEIVVPVGMSEKDILAAARAEENVKKFIEGKQLKKEIYVKGKLVSLVA